MGKWYTKEERREALKLAEEIGPAAAARRLGINVDTLYGWWGREKERAAALGAAVGGRSEAELLAEIKALEEQLKQAQQDVGILQEALFFCQAPETVSPGHKHSFIHAHLDRWPVSAMCGALEISEQGYYRSLRRPERGWRDRQLLEQIYECLRQEEENGCNYGVRRIIA